MNTRDERRQAATGLRDLQEEYDNVVANIRTIAEQLNDKHSLIYVVEHMESLSSAWSRHDSSLESWINELEDPEQDEDEVEPDDDGCDFDHPERLVGEPR